jgi:hypothetical protein
VRLSRWQHARVRKSPHGGIPATLRRVVVEQVEHDNQHLVVLTGGASGHGAVRHRGVMSARPLAAGKLPPALLGRLLALLPAAPPEVLLGPELGEDACAIEIPAGVLIAAADPITLTGADVGRYGVIVNANDVAVMGVAPRWFLATLLFPPATTDQEVERPFTGLREPSLRLSPNAGLVRCPWV